MNNQRVTNKQLLDAINGNTEKLNAINETNKGITKRLDDIEKEVKGMNDKVNNTTNNVKWIIGVGSTAILSIIGAIVTLFVNKS